MFRITMGIDVFALSGPVQFPGVVSVAECFSAFAMGICYPISENYLHRGTNKQVFYRIFHSPEEIDEQAITKLVLEAVEIDKNFRRAAKRK